MKYLGKIQDNKDLVTKEYVDNADNNKVDKVSGKGLSTNDYTTAEKNKLAGIAAGAQVNSVTGVKGNSESSYRTGNVNLTAANIGAAASSHTHDDRYYTETETDTKLEKYIPFAEYRNANGSNAGKYYKISINSYTSWMLNFTVKLYHSYQAYDLQISGYNYGTSHWYSPAAVILGSSVTTTIDVSFGYDSDWHLWVAIPAEQYTGLGVYCVANGYYKATVVQTKDNLFSIELVTGMPETLQSTKTAYRPWYRDETVTNATNAASATTAGNVTGTVAIANGGTGATTAAGAANNIFSGLPAWTADPTDDTYFPRQDTTGSASYGKVKFSTVWNYISSKANSVYQKIRPSGYAYNLNASGYTGGASKKYIRIKLPDSCKTIWVMAYIEVSIRGLYATGNGGKVYINAYHGANSPYTWQGFNFSTSGNLPNNIAVYASDGQYFYIFFQSAYQTASIDKMLIGDTASTYDLSNTVIDYVDELPGTYETALRTEKHVLYFGNQAGDLGSGTPAAATKTFWENSVPKNSVCIGYNTSGTEYTIIYSKGADNTWGNIIKWSYGDNYFRTLKRNSGNWTSDDWIKMDAGNADTVNGKTVASNVPANAVFTDTVTTATTSGSGNAVTAISATNGALTVTKGTTFLTSHQDISGKADKSATVSTVTWDSTNKKLTKTINGTTTDVVTAATLRTGLNVADGAEVNQNAFSNVKVGSTTVAADSKTDTLELVAGSNVTLTPDTTNDKVTIAATDTTYESKAAASGGTAVSLVTTGEKYTWNHKMSSIADVTTMELLTYEGTTNDVMTVGLHDDDATSKVPVVNATTGKIPASVYNNTTYESKEAASGGTAVSLVTTGEKYTWNNKQAALVSGTNIKTINNTSLLGSGNISISGGGGTTDYSDLSNKPQINSNTLSGNKTSADLGLQSALSVESQTLAVSSSFTLYSSSPYTTTDATITLRRYGRVASVTGMVKPKSAINGSDTEYTICTVPTGYRPSQPIIQLMQGSTQYHWCLKVNTDGRVTFSRYSATTSYAQASTSTWLPFHATWIIG